jgi:hypothetical protein
MTSELPLIEVGCYNYTRSSCSTLRSSVSRSSFFVWHQNRTEYRVGTAPATMAKNDKPVIEEVDGVERIRKEARPDFSVLPPRKQLPKDIQTVLDDEEKMWETISDGRYNSSMMPSLRSTTHALQS